MTGPPPLEITWLLPEGIRISGGLPVLANRKHASYLPRSRKARGPRKPSLRRMIAAAKKAGATSVTTPDGYRIAFGEPEPAPTNELDQWIVKHARPAQRH
jgi:hypothetical protein